ncbi:hypothetical protein DPSP01_002723 [Paraphaeosphaeria sporulosa]
MRPSGGIAPSDSLQDEIVNSIESTPRSRNSRTGVEHYLHIIKKKATASSVVTSDFEAYRRAAPPNDPVGDLLPEVRPQTLDLGPPDPKYDYGVLPTHELRYAEAIYKAQTWNPLIPLAIIRIAEKNLAFLNFDSMLTYLPNVEPQRFTPEFPQVEDGLLARTPAEHGLPGLGGPYQDYVEIQQWSNFRIGASGGEWLFPCLERDIITWERAEHLVGFEWKLRVAITTYSRVCISEDSFIARERDHGWWYDTRWE